MSSNVDMRLPSGAMATRTDPERAYYIWSGNGHLARLTVADVEALYADSIAGDGGREPQHFDDPPPCTRSYSSIAAAGNAARSFGVASPVIRGCGRCGGFHLRRLGGGG